MAINKKNEFNSELLALSDFAKLLSHPAKLAIIEELMKHDTCICGELVNALPLSQSTVSQHLNDMKKAGIVKGTIDGRKSCFCLDLEQLKQQSNQFSTFLTKVSSHQPLNECC